MVVQLIGKPRVIFICGCSTNDHFLSLYQVILLYIKDLWSDILVCVKKEISKRAEILARVIAITTALIIFLTRGES